MDDKEKAVVAAEKIKREDLVKTLVLEDLRGLSTHQIALCKQVDLERVNKIARDRVEAVLKEELSVIAQALTTAPFVYTSPEIQVMAGCRARFSTLMKTQLDDAHKQLDNFIAAESPNEIRISDHLNTHLLAHSLTRYNDVDFGEVVFDAIEYQGLRSTSAKDAQEVLDAVRKARLSALSALSPHLHQRLVEYYQAFQLTIDQITRGDDMDSTLGN